MAVEYITGSELDRYKKKFTDGVTHELQQATSLLTSVVTTEPGVMGKATTFDRMARSNQASEVTEDFAPRTLKRASYERREVVPHLLESVYATPELDIIRMAENPINDIVKSASMELGRDKDAIIVQAALGTAYRTVDGTYSPVSFLSANVIAVDSDTYAFTQQGGAVTGSTSLNGGKLKQAKQILASNFVDTSRTEIFCVANAFQLTNLLNSIQQEGSTRKDYLGKTPLVIPGLDLALDGYIGLRFISYEGIPQDADGNDQVLVMTRDAVKLGIWKDVSVELDRWTHIQGSPDVAVTSMTIGAVRFDDVQVVAIACVAA